MERLRLPKTLEERMDGPSKVRFNIKKAGMGTWTLQGNSEQEYNLTNSEFKILHLLCSYGFSNRKLAEKMGLNFQTVRNYIYTIARTINVEEESSKPNPEEEITRLNIINKLLAEGVLTYKPIISVDKTPIANFKKGVFPHTRDRNVDNTTK